MQVADSQVEKKSRRVIDFGSNKKDFVHCEAKVHTVWHRLLKSWQRHKLQHISSYFACFYQLRTEYQASKYFKKAEFIKQSSASSSNLYNAVLKILEI